MTNTVIKKEGNREKIVRCEQAEERVKNEIVYKEKGMYNECEIKIRR